MVKDSVKLVSPKLLDQNFNVISNSDEKTVAKKATYKKWSAYIRGKAPEEFRKNAKNGYYLRVRNVP